MHANIEYYLNSQFDKIIENKELQLFISFWNDFKQQYPYIIPYRTEWVVYDEDEFISGSIDFVLSDNNNNLVIMDWKRSKEIKFTNKWEKGYKFFDTYENCNYNHYSLQLNFYRHILETKYNKKVIYMMLVILHPDQDSYICHEVPYIELKNIWKGIANV